jgi:hypothetical protein
MYSKPQTPKKGFLHPLTTYPRAGSTQIISLKKPFLGVWGLEYIIFFTGAISQDHLDITMHY